VPAAAGNPARALLLFQFARDVLAIRGNLAGAKAAASLYYNIFLCAHPNHHDAFGVYWSLSLEEQFYTCIRS
jgi:peptidoglycan/LPS O-acetylase OafA/YrhL